MEDKIDEYFLTTKNIPDYTTIIFYKDNGKNVEVLLTNKGEPPSFLNCSFEINENTSKIDFFKMIEYVKNRIFVNAKIIDYVPARLIESCLFIAVKVEKFELKKDIPLVKETFSSIDVFFEKWMIKLKKQINNTQGVTLAII